MARFGEHAQISRRRSWLTCPRSRTERSIAARRRGGRGVDRRLARAERAVRARAAGRRDAPRGARHRSRSRPALRARIEAERPSAAVRTRRRVLRRRPSRARSRRWCSALVADPARRARRARRRSARRPRWRCAAPAVRRRSRIHERPDVTAQAGRPGGLLPQLGDELRLDGGRTARRPDQRPAGGDRLLRVARTRRSPTRSSSAPALKLPAASVTHAARDRAADAEAARPLGRHLASARTTPACSRARVSRRR